ncbi:MAG: hypothetical protein KC420_21370, partial [Myxococcales bacterium]|nr:hypothetical protein [Myxococcales bacterium]
LSFTVDSTHGAPVAWIAQRNALLAAIFAVACLLAHDRWRRGGARAGPLAALVFLACALLSAELGVSTIALLVAYGLALDPAGWRRGLWATLPAGALAILWLALYGALGFGARACGAYVDPIHSPAIFLGLLPERLAALVMMDLGPSQAIHLAFEAWPLRVAAQALAWAAAAIVIGVVVARLRGDHYLRFATIAFALALAPIASSIPGDRLLLIASVASSAMIAGTIVALAGDRRRLARVAAALVAIVHLVLAPIALVASFEPITRYVFGAPIDAVGRELAEPQALAHQSLIVVHAPSVLHGLQLPGYRALAGLGAPAFTHVLGSGPGPALVTRTGPRALELREPAGFLVDPTASFYRGVDVPLRTGDTVATLAYRAEVIEVDGAGRPTLVRFEFTRKLEHPSLRLVAWDGRDYVDLAPPAIGEAIRLP